MWLRSCPLESSWGDNGRRCHRAYVLEHRKERLWIELWKERSVRSTNSFFFGQKCFCCGARHDAQQPRILVTCSCARHINQQPRTLPPAALLPQATMWGRTAAWQSLWGRTQVTYWLQSFVRQSREAAASAKGNVERCYAGGIWTTIFGMMSVFTFALEKWWLKGPSARFAVVRRSMRLVNHVYRSIKSVKIWWHRCRLVLRVWHVRNMFNSFAWLPASIDFNASLLHGSLSDMFWK